MGTTLEHDAVHGADQQRATETPPAETPLASRRRFFATAATAAAALVVAAPEPL